MDVAVRRGRWEEREGAEEKRRASIEFLVAESGPEMSHWGNTTERREEGEEDQEQNQTSLPSAATPTAAAAVRANCVCARAHECACVFSGKSFCKCAVSKTSPIHTGSVFLDPNLCTAVKSMKSGTRRLKSHRTS